MKLLLIVIIALLFILLFCNAFKFRKYKNETLVIDSSCKDPKKGLDWYFQTIDQFLVLLRFKREEQNGVALYIPVGLQLVISNEIKVIKDPLYIEIEASSYYIKILKKHLELN